MVKWKAYPINGWWWLGIEVNNKWTPLIRKGQVGWCILF